MHPELVGKKVVTEEGLDVGYIDSIKTDDLGSVVAVITTNYESYPRLKVAVINLRRKESEQGEVVYIIPTSRIPIQLLNEIKTVAEMRAREEEKVEELPPVPEVPPLEQFKKEEVVAEEKAPEVEEVVEEEIEEAPIEEVKREGGGILGFLRRIIEAIKRLFGAR